MGVKEPKIITLTGPDRCGKATQAHLLAAAMGDDAQQMSFPVYSNWTGRILKSIYHGETFWVRRDDMGPGYKQDNEPLVALGMHLVDKLCAQGDMNRALAGGYHLVCDRYDADLFLYGQALGVPNEHLLAMLKMVRGSDLTICLVGGPYPREGETLDLNESDQELQDRVREACYHYSGWIWQSGRRVSVIPGFAVDEKDLQIALIHRRIVRTVNEYLNTSYPVLPEQQAVLDTAETLAGVPEEK